MSGRGFQVKAKPSSNNQYLICHWHTRQYFAGESDTLIWDSSLNMDKAIRFATYEQAESKGREICNSENCSLLIMESFSIDGKPAIDQVQRLCPDNWVLLK